MRARSGKAIWITSAFLLTSTAGLGLEIVGAPSAGAATTWTVTNCGADGSDPGSLVYAVANASAGDDITFAPGLDCSTTGDGPITITSVLSVMQDLTITGNGPSTTVISGGGTTALFNISNGANVTMSGLTLEDGNGGGNPHGNGGAIDLGDGSSGSLSLSSMAFVDNSATSVEVRSGDWSYPADGGAIDSGDDGGSGSLTIASTTFSGNSAAGDGGAIDNGDDGGVGTLDLTTSILRNNATQEQNGGAIDSGDNGGSATANISQSLFEQNSAGSVAQNYPANGGAIDSGDNGGTSNLAVATSTLADNTASRSGGAISSGSNGGAGTSKVNRSTFSDNSAASGGAVAVPGGATGGVTLFSDTLNSTNSGAGGLIAGPTASGGAVAEVAGSILASSVDAPCSGTVSDLGDNVSNDASGSCQLTGPGSVANATTLEASLGSLGDDGGPTPTIEPAPGSPAVGLVPVGTQVEGDTLCPAGDQRGVASSGPCTAGSVFVPSVFGVAFSPLPTATPGQAFGPVQLVPFAVTASASPYVTSVKWTKVSLPKGLSLSSKGVLAGTLSAKNAVGPVTLEVKVSETITTVVGHKKTKQTITATDPVALTVVG